MPAYQTTLFALRGIWRFRWLALSTFVILTFGAWLYFLYQPNWYVAQAEIQWYVTGNEADDDRQAATSNQFQDLLDGVRKEREESSQLGREVHWSYAADSRNTDEYAISSGHRDQSVALSQLQAFVEELESTVTSINEQRRSYAETLDVEIASHSRHLQAIEVRLIALQGRAANISDDDGQSVAEIDNRLKMESELLRQYRVSLASIDAAIASQSEQMASVRSEPSAVPISTERLDLQIAEVEGELDRLLTQYTTRHPDVVAAQERLDNLNTLRRNAVAAYEEANAARETATDSQLNDLRQERIHSEELVRRQESVVRNLRAELQILSQDASELDETDQQLASLMDEHELVGEAYRDLVVTRDSLLDPDGSTIRGLHVMSIASPASLNLLSDRVQKMLQALVSALCVAVLVAWLSERLAPLLRNSLSVPAEFSAEVLGEIRYCASLDRSSYRFGNPYPFVAAASAILMLLLLLLMYQDGALLVIDRVAEFIPVNVARFAG